MPRDILRATASIYDKIAFIDKNLRRGETIHSYEGWTSAQVRFSLSDITYISKVSYGQAIHVHFLNEIRMFERWYLENDQVLSTRPLSNKEIREYSE